MVCAKWGTVSTWSAVCCWAAKSLSGGSSGSEGGCRSGGGAAPADGIVTVVALSIQIKLVQSVSYSCMHITYALYIL